MNSRERKAHHDIADTARLRAMSPVSDTSADDPLEQTQVMDTADRRARASEGARERRKPLTRGERAAALNHARDIFADRQEELIEAGVWPVFHP